MSVAQKAKKLIFVLGGPGSGKGTQCQRLKQDFNFCHISVGELMRNEIDLYLK
jgi:adenylate kinase family enzyme